MNRLTCLSLAIFVFVFLTGCPSAPSDLLTGDGTSTGTDGTGTDGTGTTDDDSTTDGGGTDTTGGDSQDGAAALGYNGTMSARVSTSVSTSETDSTGGAPTRWIPDVEPQGRLFPAGQTAGAIAYFKDLDGNPLLDADGNEYPPTPVNADGTFTATGLPVGVDFMVEVDLDGDGEPDLSHIASIPQGEEGEDPSVEDVDINPLTTMAVAKLRTVLTSKGVTSDDLDFSPAAVINQLLDSFQTLFEVMGIDSTITADQIAAQTIDALASAFDQLVPDSVKTTMDMAEGKLDLAEASTAEELVLAMAPVLLKAGFAIADEPGGVELDSLADLPNIEVVTRDEMWELKEPGPPPGPGPGPGPSPEGSTLPADEGNRIFRSTADEVDRNFAKLDEVHGCPECRPIIHKHALERMAGLEIAGMTLSIGDLYTLVTDLAQGMGMRMTYWIPMPPQEPGDQPSPPPTMFQSEDKYGVEIDMWAMEQQLRQIMDQHVSNPAEFEQKADSVRQILAVELAETVPPSLEQLFGGLISDKPVTFDQLTARIRQARAHLPFNFSGNATFWVIADGDPFRDGNAEAVTVDATFDSLGQLAKVVYNADGEGKYYLRRGPWGPEQYWVELLVRVNGQMVFDNEGMQVVGDLTDETVFLPVDGTAFFDLCSETGTFWPFEPKLSLPNPWFDPDLPPDPNNNPPEFIRSVLVDQPGPEGEAILVSRDDGGNVAVDPDGDYALGPFWDEDDVMWFEFINTSTGYMLTEDGEEEPDSPMLRVLPEEIEGLNVEAQEFTHLYDTEAPNPTYDPQGDPWYDDVDGDGTWDSDEPTFSWREEIGNPDDWRSTNVERYYRRADNDGFVRNRDVDFGSNTPQTFTGVTLVPREFKRRNNAFAYGRPNSALNLLSASLPPNFFNGMHVLNRDTRISVFGALSMLNLVFDARLYNLEAYIVDYGPSGARPAALQVVDAQPWIPPMGDPFSLLTKGFEDLAEAE